MRLPTLLAIVLLAGCYWAPPVAPPVAPPAPPWEPPPVPGPIEPPPPPPPVSGDVGAALEAITVGMDEATVRGLFTKPPVAPPPDAGAAVYELRWYFGSGRPETLLWVRFGRDGKVLSRNAVPVVEVP